MIEINNLSRSRVNKKFLKKIAEKVLKSENKKEADLSIVLVGLKRIKTLNKRYRRKDRVTDVLSFPFEEKKNLGEIVICFQVVKKNAKRFSSTLKKELARVLIHGLLHLLGYDHERSKKEAEKMKKKEEYYLSQIIKFKDKI